MLDFSQKSIFEIEEIISHKIQHISTNEIIEFIVLNPDININRYSGYKHTIKNNTYIHHTYKTWLDMSQIYCCVMLTPEILSENFVKIKYKKLNQNISFHKDDLKEEKYGTKSEFFNINKNEEIGFLYYYKLALQTIKIDKKIKILNIGINKGDEFDTIIKILKDTNTIDNIEFVGIDYSKSIIDFATNKFTHHNFRFIQADINDIDNLCLDKFDLIISIGTLQSSNINFKLLFNNLIQNYLRKDGSVILGFPNSRWIDGSMIYGAKMKNYSFSDISLIIKDIHYCKKYLQQKRYKVNIFGKDYIFLVANKIKV
jgi:2-polyprenyl-3-methyl-5-hydroxy-6-metoxy-1,4-benzoquinol methylase